MATPPSPKVLQDVAPKGGFPILDFRRNIPFRRGPHGAVILGAVTGMFVFGLAGVIHQNNRDAEENRLQTEARLIISTIYQAEEDARYVAALKKQSDADNEIMKHVPGWKPDQSPYHTKSWSRPSL